tara:strand:- start:3006 stop:5078 length:2073 start_codon:yes stop_codon:yes gene_type:complete
MHFSKFFISTVYTVITALNFSLSAQTTLPCGTDENLANEIARNAKREDKLFETDNLIQTYLNSKNSSSTEQLQIIPVVFHVIYSNNKDNISDAQIQDALNILNEDMRRNNPDTSNLRSIFKPVAADLEIEFRLAQKDPNGNCTNGITRTQSNLSLTANNNVKAILNWDNKKYLNIWVVKNISLSGTAPGTRTLGYSAFPFNNIPGTSDGVVIRHDNFGSIGTSQGERYRTLTHEVGHYLNLYHTFQGGCNGGDNCPDTPPVSSASNGCNNSTQNSCNFDSPDLPDMVENYMDYSDNDCMNTFTQNQKQRAKAVLNIFNLRGSLTTSSNHFFTGINQTSSIICYPKADFSIDKNLICSGEQIQITENCQYQAPPSFHYTISDQNNGNQKHITTGSPILTFNNPGIYDIKLEIQNSDGQSTKQYAKLLTVRPAGGLQYSPFFSATMENIIPNEIWTHLNNGDNFQWERTSIAAKSGLYSYFLNNFNISTNGGGDCLIAGPISLNNPSALLLKFNHAFAKRYSSNSDQLKIFTSIDCGNSWVLKRIIPAFQLGTTTLYANSPYIPSNGDWKETTINLNGLSAETSLMIKFEMFSGGGNNIYLDNLNISFTANNVQLTKSNEIFIYPNPSNNNALIEISENGDIYIIDAIGRVVQINKNASKKTRILDLPAGSYTAVFINNEGERKQVRWTNLP